MWKSRDKFFARVFFALALCLVISSLAEAQRFREDAEFGPVVRAYLGYLRAQQEVVDDRVSRREIDRRYYLHNSKRIRALREVAIRLARETEIDYLPELEAVSLNEFDQLFEEPLPDPAALRAGETLSYKLRFLQTVIMQREKFYVFARLDPYEQAELRKQGEAKVKAEATGEPGQPAANDSATRARRANSP